MSYQALARKWRPRLFKDVVGQEHVVRALSNALDQGRVHHAFLFTGTRGVGKTTLARILAKALNCDQGVSSQPCNECPACTAIDEGRFVDLIEVDAASRTKVDETRELLDNVQYAPTQGRYKVYLIDEVHMLSGHSFNALLKTLEEPPPHVKFLLATTDPQKLPVTVLSRCLQFHLKALAGEAIAEQLRKILQMEEVVTEEPALRLLARAADGSMRDGLSLLDQAIAHGGGEVRETMVRDMLGTLDSGFVRDLLQALANRDGAALMQVVATMAERSVDYGNALDEVLLQTYHLGLAKAVPDALRAKQVEEPWHQELAAQFGDEELQLLYQIAMIGKRDLDLAPDPRTGFEMAMLRLLAFQPAEVVGGAGTAGQGPAEGPPVSSIADRRQSAAGPRVTSPVDRQASGDKPAAGPPVSETRKPRKDDKKPPVQDTTRAKSSPADANAEVEWAQVVEQLNVNGWVRELATNIAHETTEDNCLKLKLHPKLAHLLSPEREQVLNQAVREILGDKYQIQIETGESRQQSPAQAVERRKAERQAEAEQRIRNDPNVKKIMQKFDATLIDGSIKAEDI